MYGAFDQPLSEEELKDATDASKDFAFTHGSLFRKKSDSGSADSVQHVPIALFPSLVPRDCYFQAEAVQTDFNLLMHRIAHDHEFLEECFKDVVKVDSFIRNIWEIYETVRKEGVQQPICLAMNRSDYMMDCRSTDRVLTIHDLESKIHQISLKQVEFNTMASGAAGLSQRVNIGHRYILRSQNQRDLIKHIPDRKPVDGLAQALIAAWKLYGNERAVILFLVYRVERNIYDQRWLEYSVLEQNDRVRIIRRSIQDVQQRAELTEDKRLVIDGLEVAIIYQRSGYTPKDFEAEGSWEGRLMMERSKAIVCPTAAYHLAGTKKVQQILAKPGVVERFIQDAATVQRIRATFAQLYSLDNDEEGDKNVAMAIEDPERFVLKPQREGGGNNKFGQDLKNFLLELKDSEDRSSYILMERLRPMVVYNYPINPDQPITLTEMVSELGIYGALIGTKDKIYLNEPHGYLLRTKKVGTNEGGIATGFCVLDTPFLV